MGARRQMAKRPAGCRFSVGEERRRPFHAADFCCVPMTPYTGNPDTRAHPAPPGAPLLCISRMASLYFTCKYQADQAARVGPAPLLRPTTLTSPARLLP